MLTDFLKNNKTSLLFIMLFYLFTCGCDSSKTSTDQSSNMGTPGCPLCGNWEIPKRPDRLISKISILPDKFELKIDKFGGPDCKYIIEGWNSVGDRKGVIRFDQNLREICDNRFTQHIEINEMKYIVGKYSLILTVQINENSIELLYVRSGVKIPEHHNPLLGKWGYIKRDETPDDFKGKWNKDNYSIWFKNDSIKSDNISYVKEYIIENDMVIVINKNGTWGVVEIIDINSILLIPGPFLDGAPKWWMKYQDEKIKYIRIE